MTEHNKDSSRTSTLLRKLINAADIGQFMECNSDALEIPPFHEYITSVCKKAGMIPEQAIKHAGIDRTYGHQLFNGTRKPSRDKVIQLAFGMGMDLDETQKLLQIAQKSPLYPKIKRDAAILFCINQHKDLFETQGILQSLGISLLGEE